MCKVYVSEGCALCGGVCVYLCTHVHLVIRCIETIAGSTYKKVNVKKHTKGNHNTQIQYKSIHNLYIYIFYTLNKYDRKKD